MKTALALPVHKGYNDSVNVPAARMVAERPAPAKWCCGRPTGPDSNAWSSASPKIGPQVSSNPSLFSQRPFPSHWFRNDVFRFFPHSFNNFSDLWLNNASSRYSCQTIANHIGYLNQINRFRRDMPNLDSFSWLVGTINALHCCCKFLLPLLSFNVLIAPKSCDCMQGKKTSQQRPGGEQLEFDGRRKLCTFMDASCRFLVDHQGTNIKTDRMCSPQEAKLDFITYIVTTKLSPRIHREMLPNISQHLSQCFSVFDSSQANDIVVLMYSCFCQISGSRSVQSSVQFHLSSPDKDRASVRLKQTSGQFNPPVSIPLCPVSIL